jgi:hypothetical protein
MQNIEKYFLFQPSPEEEKIQELVRAGFEYIKNNFNLPLELEQKLDYILNNLANFIKSYYSPPLISFVEIFHPDQISKNIQDTGGICYINPYNFRAEFNVIRKDEDDPYSIAEKMIHELLHYLGTSISEVEILTQENEEKTSAPILDMLNEIYRGKYKFSERIQYRIGFIKSEDLILKDELSGIKYLLVLPNNPIDGIFYESVVDYFSKNIMRKIIKEENRQTDFTSGYITRIMLALCIYNAAYLLKEFNQKNYDENIEELENFLKLALITGDLSGFIQEVNKLDVNTFIERLINIISEFKNMNPLIRNKMENAVNNVKSQLKELKEQSLFEIIKLLIFEFYKQSLS